MFLGNLTNCVFKLLGAMRLQNFTDCYNREVVLMKPALQIEAASCCCSGLGANREVKDVVLDSAGAAAAQCLILVIV